MRLYAQQTSVPIERSRGKVERTYPACGQGRRAGICAYPNLDTGASFGHGAPIVGSQIASRLRPVRLWGLHYLWP